MGTPSDEHKSAKAIDESMPDFIPGIVAHLPQALAVTNSTGQILFLNQRFMEAFGVPDPHQLKGQSLKAFFKTLSADLSSDTFIAGERHYRSEQVAMEEQQAVLWLFTDETKQIRETETLREQRKFYEDVLNSIPSDIAVFSPDHKYLYINPVGLGDPEVRQWLIGKDDFDYCARRGKDPSFAQHRRDVFNEIIASGKQKEWEERIVNKNGEEEYHLRKLTPIYDQNNRFVWMIGYSVNITERKKIEEKIQVSEKRYRDLFNYSQAIICTHDMQGVFLSVNPSLLEVMGYTEDEVIGKNISSFLAPDDRQAFDDLYLTSIRENSKVKGIFRVMHKNGTKVYLLYQNYRVAESEDSEAYIIAFAQDITDRINVEKQLKDAKKITEETARNKEKFLANMSHEIRTPMNGIIGITAFLQRTDLSPEQARYLKIIQEAANDLLTIINDILDLEKIGTGQIQLEHIPFDIIGKTSTVVSLFEVSAREKQVQLKFDNQVGNTLAVTGDPTRFNQVLNNLISNAVKFTHNGTVTVEVSVLHETDEQVSLRFAVSDTGIGIDPVNIEKIFHPFTQAYPETARMYGGTGLGLAITRNLVELQGGTISVTSRPRKGSTFTFIIPFEKASTSQKNLLDSIRSVKNELGPLRILVAEDNEVNMVLTTGMLRHLGFEPTPARSGTEVMELMAQQEFDLVLMDIQMPGMNGFEATAAIRNLKDHRATTPIVALTATALKGEEESYYAAGMNGYLTKPFTEAAIYDEIDSVIRNTHSLTPKPTEMSQTFGNEKLYDLSLVSELARGNKEFIYNLAKIFIETVPVTAKDMVDACAQKQWEQMGKHAHKLKSTIDTMNIAILKDDIRAIEKNGKEQKNLDVTPGLVEKADEVIRTVTQQLKTEFNL